MFYRANRTFASMTGATYWGTKKGQRNARLGNQLYFNPWYKEPALGMLGWGLGVINPMDNKVPFIPWL